MPNLSTLLRGSWKTSSIGALVFFAALVQPLIEGRPITQQHWLIGLIGVGLMFARDNNKTSEDVGATKEPNEP